MEQVRDTNPEYDSVDASQGTKASDSHSPKNQVKGNCHNISECHIRKSKHLKGQLRPRQKRNDPSLRAAQDLVFEKGTKLFTSEQSTDQNPDYEPSSIYDSMENDQKDIRVMFSSSIWLNLYSPINVKR